MFLRPLVFLLLLTVVTLDRDRVRLYRVETSNGKCIFKNDKGQEKLIEDRGEAFDIEECEGIICTVDDIKDPHSRGQVAVFECGNLTGISKDGKECPLNRTTGYYPHCCFGELVCN